MWIRLNDVIVSSGSIESLERNSNDVEILKKDGRRYRVSFLTEEDAASAFDIAHDRLMMEDGGKLLEMRMEKIKDVSIEKVINDTRTLNILRKMEIRTLGELSDVPEKKFREMDYVGDHVINTIKNALETSGLEMKRK